MVGCYTHGHFLPWGHLTTKERENSVTQRHLVCFFLKLHVVGCILKNHNIPFLSQSEMEQKLPCMSLHLDSRSNNKNFCTYYKIMEVDMGILADQMKTRAMNFDILG